jgi:molecular chaperone GrpE (heat shock protein)
MPRKESDARPSNSSGRKTSPPGDAEDAKRQFATAAQNLQSTVLILKDKLEEVKRNDQEIRGLGEHITGLRQQIEQTSGNTQTSESLTKDMAPDEKHERTQYDTNGFVDAGLQIIDDIARALETGSEPELQRCIQELELLNQRMELLQNDLRETRQMRTSGS